MYDTLVRSVRTRPPDDHIVVVDVDERSLSAIGQWPWRRDVVGHLITRLRGLGASMVALDIILRNRTGTKGQRPPRTWRWPARSGRAGLYTALR
jgi:adenylate cyclase